MQKFRILIVDDHPLARKAVRSLLEDEREFEIVGEAENGETAIAACGVLQPDVVLMDIRMPDMDGLTATRLIKMRHADVKVVILSASDAAADLFSAVQFGAQGYLLKDLEPADWLSYLHALLKDDAEIPRKMADRLFYRFKGNVSPAAEKLHALTPREKDILAYIARGDTNRQIAESLVITEHTVKNHVKNMLEKLQLDNRVQLAASAVQHGFEAAAAKRGK
jgi:two-component system, NarL family, nitrate/nitrite response regulator NarL